MVSDAATSVTTQNPRTSQRNVSSKVHAWNDHLINHKFWYAMLSRSVRLCFAIFLNSHYFFFPSKHLWKTLRIFYYPPQSCSFHKFNIFVLPLIQNWINNIVFSLWIRLLSFLVICISLFINVVKIVLRVVILLLLMRVISFWKRWIFLQQMRKNKNSL